ncbi:hypothetical protein [Streptomyces sp. NBC_00620]|uniref:hypothetical protein n=1 Tax=Streptomyces sp. NBC_00620 TaxID=2903666 RepID=UPI00224CABB8|nr:hypothetical protein [Streptomyces sp. NBC_00620]MCX4974921.1 hypothetical protein [Streptomyces sp. NBC_00620]
MEITENAALIVVDVQQGFDEMASSIPRNNPAADELSGATAVTLHGGDFARVVTTEELVTATATTTFAGG